ncbi:MAG TPA: HAD family hydrolase [Verrucomicrobiae bacterium]|nr:HAD family hydrolase [Verrucomicrobiae bacterium]
MIRLVLFDIDGTMIRTGGAGVKAFARTFASVFGVERATENMKFAGRTDSSLVREFFREHRVPESEENFARFYETYVFWLDHFLHHNRGDACPGVAAIIGKLQRLSEPPLLGLLTGNIRLGAEIKLRHYGLWDSFETGAFGDEHESRNQLAAIAHQRGCHRLNHSLAGDEVLVIGDTPLDIECGRSIGAKVLAVATGGATLNELAAHRPDWAVEHLELVDAAAICR